MTLSEIYGSGEIVTAAVNWRRERESLIQIHETPMKTRLFRLTVTTTAI